MKIIKFFRNYKKYILVGMIIGVFIGLLVFLEIRNRREEEKIPYNKELISPFWDSREFPKPSIEVRVDGYLGEKLPVYEILAYNKDVFEIIKTFDSEINKPSSLDDSFRLESDKIVVWYSKDAGVLRVKLKQKDSLPIVKTTQDVYKLVENIFGYRTNIDSIYISKSEDGGFFYKGRYVLDSVAKEEFGSSEIGSYAYQIETDSVGNIKDMSILLYNENSINIYSLYSPASIKEGLESENALYKSTSFDDNYSQQPIHIILSIKTKSTSIKKITKAYIMTSYTSGYLFPTYVMEGDSRLEDGIGNTYVADVLVYVLAIDPQYVVKKIGDIAD